MKRRILCLAIFVSLSFICLLAQTVQAKSGIWTHTEKNAFGNCIYEISYTAPDTILTGSTQTIEVSMKCKQLEGSTVSVVTKYAELIISTPAGKEVKRSFADERTLRQNDVWGPLRISFVVVDNDVALNPGQKTSAKIKIVLHFSEIGEVLGMTIGEYSKAVSNDFDIDTTVVSSEKVTPMWAYEQFLKFLPWVAGPMAAVTVAITVVIKRLHISFG